MDCCTVHGGLGRMFGTKTAQREARKYRQKGAAGRILPLLDYLASQRLNGASVLDIGFGVGELHFELLRRNAARVTGIEVSRAYLDAAGELAGEMGFSDAVDYRLGDYALEHDELPAADIVVLDRSVCCYPDWKGLVAPSAQKAGRFYALVLPVDRWFVRAGLAAANAVFALIRHDFRAYMHPRDEIEATINAAGLQRVFTKRVGVWESMVYARA